MKESEPVYDVQKRARAGTSATLRAAVALYIIYLGFSIIRGVREGGTSMSPALGWSAGLVFIAAALAFGVYTWKRWRREVEAARLPASSLTEGEEDS